MIPTKTTVVGHIDVGTSEKLKQELALVPWTLHHDSEKYLRGGALRFGETSWIVKTNDWLTVLEDNSNLFTESDRVACQYLGNDQQFGRRYWHKLSPGDIIEIHSDSEHIFSKFIEHRYQVFLDIPDGFEIFCDNEIKDAKSFANSVVDFNLLAPHAYANRSSETVYLMVFDIFDKSNLPVFGTP